MFIIKRTIKIYKIEAGVEEGIIKIAKAMLEKNIPIETIMEIT